MTPELVAILGWACAATVLTLHATVRLRTGQRMALVAEASHELRGPLTAVSLGLASLARDPEPARARQAAALDLELQRAGLALEDLAAAPHGRRAPDAASFVDVGDLLRDLTEAWTPAAVAFGSRIVTEELTAWWVVRADRLRLAQALGNLIANALEHGEGPVRLRARSAAQAGAIRLEVVDGGCGPGVIALPAASRRGHAERRGHGLTVAARVAERCGGALRAERGRDGHVMSIELELA